MVLVRVMGHLVWFSGLQVWVRMLLMGDRGLLVGLGGSWLAVRWLLGVQVFGGG